MESGALSTLLCPKERSAGSPTCSLLGDPTPLPLLPLHPSRRNSHSIPPPIVLSSRHPSPVSSTSGGLFLTCLHTSSLNLVLLFLFSFTREFILLLWLHRCVPNLPSPFHSSSSLHYLMFSNGVPAFRLARLNLPPCAWSLCCARLSVTPSVHQPW